MVQAAPWFPAPPAVSLPRSPVNPNHVAPSHGPPARVLSPLYFPARSLLLPKPCGKGEGALQSCMVLTLAKAMWSQPFSMVAAPGFKSQHQSSSAAPFPTPPTISYTCQHFCIFPALLGCHSKSGQVWPCGVEPMFSKLLTQVL